MGFLEGCTGETIGDSTITITRGDDHTIVKEFKLGFFGLGEDEKRTTIRKIYQILFGIAQEIDDSLPDDIRLCLNDGGLFRQARAALETAGVNIMGMMPVPSARFEVDDIERIDYKSALERSERAADRCSQLAEQNIPIESRAMYLRIFLSDEDDFKRAVEVEPKLSPNHWILLDQYPSILKSEEEIEQLARMPKEWVEYLTSKDFDLKSINSEKILSLMKISKSNLKIATTNSQWMEDLLEDDDDPEDDRRKAYGGIPDKHLQLVKNLAGLLIRKPWIAEAFSDIPESIIEAIEQNQDPKLKKNFEQLIQDNDMTELCSWTDEDAIFLLSQPSGLESILHDTVRELPCFQGLTETHFDLLRYAGLVSGVIDGSYPALGNLADIPENKFTRSNYDEYQPETVKNIIVAIITQSQAGREYLATIKKHNICHLLKELEEQADGVISQDAE